MPNIDQDYQSPRWSNEIIDCAMPMTFDTYSTCSFNCLYCFSFFQKSHTMKGYAGGKKVRSVNPQRVRNLFNYAKAHKDEEIAKPNRQFTEYIRDEVLMQWGGLADQFDRFERGLGVTLELMKFFDEIDYPLSYSTKGVWWTKEDEYMDLVEKHAHNWHYKVSIITDDTKKAKGIERMVPAPAERYKAIERLADAGAHVTLRLRPFILGVSDDWRKVIHKAAQAGADSVTTEFFCLELRADDRLKGRYKEMSKYVDYDFYDYYRKHSRGSGLQRLSYDMKTPIIEKMREFAHNRGLRFYVSDAHHKAKSDFTNCCGVPPDWNSYSGQFAEALQIAKRKGVVTWEDIKHEAKKYMDGYDYYRATGHNTVSSRNRSRHLHQSMYDWLQNQWNQPKKGHSPFSEFDGAIYPVGKTDSGNLKYKLNCQKTGIKCRACENSPA